MSAKPSMMQAPDYLSKCHSCNYGLMELPASGQEWHLECNVCDTILMCYRPMPHQAAFHADTATFRMFAGGYGSAKTTTACAEIIRHIFETPKGTTLIGAATLPQLEQTAMKTFFEMYPERLIVHYNKQKNYVDCLNGHRVIFRPLDDEGKARSLNLTAFWIEEASEVKYEYFVQLQTRLRNTATTQHIGLLSTNPDLGWIRTEFLLVSKIFNAEEEYAQNEEKINPSFSTHIAATRLNMYLPPNYEENTARGKPEWWVRRYLKGSFSHAEGLVYPMYNQYLYNHKNKFPNGTPKVWEVGQASDFGLKDPTATLWGTIDPSTGDVYIFDEHYEAEQPVDYHAEKMLQRLNQVPIGRLRFLVGDPKGAARSTKDKSSTFDHYAEYGVYFSPATNRIDDGIMKVFTYFRLGKLHIADHLTNLIWEFENYKYPERKLERQLANADKPVDKDNHLMDCLRYFVQELPDDPNYLKNKSIAYSASANGIKPLSQDHLPYALRDDSDPYATQESWLSY